ncbi:inositol monophosphatase [Trebonia kvetii]|uniref:Inositol-1-monophosphatase n=1 Tax=Trebonia kvetii TaxID=2480626 RepID=A0A6P2C1K6_9ACTN|nr:inositol monophosphatase family protein [Trebonia kvetii]TVZ03343.1 inositol monophosphatase [Trebonia kvetii]
MSGLAVPGLAELRDLAVGVAREAGELLASRAGRVEVAATKSSPTDVVTEMDRRAEDLIRARLLAARPGDAILGEEAGETGDSDAAPVRWVVDPLDGTVNYLYGLHDWAVSIAAEVGGVAGGEVGGVAGGEVGRTIVAGAVYVPMRGELFSASLGGGAWLESEMSLSAAIAPPGVQLPRVRLHCRPGVPLSQALVGTGFGYQTARRKVQGEVVGALLPQVRDIRRAGVASIDLCAIATGRLDGYYERGLNYWDWAAGALVASESGARVGGLHGAPVSSSMTVAAGPGLFGPLSDALAALNPERDA